jgi:hypothetical protein
MNNEQIIRTIMNEIEELKKTDTKKTQFHYIVGLIDMAFYTDAITHEKSRELMFELKRVYSDLHR